jgi:mRNA interferase RelE/StbE
MAFRVELLPSAVKALESLPPVDRARIAGRIGSLRDNPRPPGSKALKGGGAGLRRLRSGDYRILYRIRNEVLLVLVVAVGHRRDVYRGL